MPKTYEYFELVFEGRVIATGREITFPVVRKTSPPPTTMHGEVLIRPLTKEYYTKEKPIKEIKD